MNTITKKQLIAALTGIYQTYQDTPEEFGGYSTPEQDAVALAESIFDATSTQVA